MFFNFWIKYGIIFTNFVINMYTTYSKFDYRPKTHLGILYLLMFKIYKCAYYSGLQLKLDK